MPASKQISTYPYDFQLLADRFATDSAPVRLTFNDPKKAQVFRFRLYGFKGAILHESNNWPAGTPSPRERWGNFLATNLKLDGSILIIQMPEDDEAVQMLRSALATPPGDTGAPVAADVEGSREAGFAPGNLPPISPFSEPKPAAPAVSAVESAVEDYLQKDD